MKPQSFLVRAIKHQILATVRLIKNGIKRYVLQLLSLETELEEAMKEQLDSFQNLKDDVLSQLNQAAWEHLKKWSGDPYKWECNDNAYLCKIHPRSRDMFKAFQVRFDALELESRRKDDIAEKKLFETSPDPSEEEKVRAFSDRRILKRKG